MFQKVFLKPKCTSSSDSSHKLCALSADRLQQGLVCQLNDYGWPRTQNRSPPLQQCYTSSSSHWDCTLRFFRVMNLLSKGFRVQDELQNGRPTHITIHYNTRYTELMLRNIAAALKRSSHDLSQMSGVQANLITVRDIP